MPAQEGTNVVVVSILGAVGIFLIMKAWTEVISMDTVDVKGTLPGAVQTVPSSAIAAITLVGVGGLIVLFLAALRAGGGAGSIR